MAAQTTVELERIVVRLVGETADYINSLHEATRETEKFVEKVTLNVNKVVDAFKGLGVAVSVPLAALGKKAIDEFSKFDDAIVKSTSLIVDMTEKQKGQLRDLALTMSLSSKQGPEELAKSYYYLLSAGLNVEQTMDALPVVTNFATAGMMNLDTATKSVISILNALGLKSKDVNENLAQTARITDVLVRASSLSTATVNELTDALSGQAGAAMKVFNVSLETGVANLMAFSDQGIKGATASNAFARALRIIADVASRNKEAFEKVGIKVFDKGEMRNIEDIVGDLQAKFKGASTETRALALNFLGFETRVQTALLPLLGTTAAVKEYTKQLSKASGFSKQVAEKQMESFAGQMTLVSHYVEVAGIMIGSILAPSLSVLTGYAKQVINYFLKMGEATREIIVRTIALTGSIMGVIGSIALIRTAYGLLFAGLGGLPALILGVTIAVSAAVSVLLNYYGSFDKMVEGINNYFVSIGVTFEGIWNSIKSVAKSFWDSIGRDIVMYVSGFIITIGGFVAVFISNFDKILKYIAAFSASFLKLIDLPFSFLSDQLISIEGGFYSLTAMVKRFYEWFAMIPGPLGKTVALLSSIAIIGGIVYGTIKTLIFAFGILKAVMAVLGILQVLSIAKWVLWSIVVGTAQIAMGLYNAQLFAWNALLAAGSVETLVAAAATTVFNAVLAVTDALMAPAALAAAVGTIILLGGAFVTAGIAVYALYRTAEETFDLLRNAKGLTEPISAVFAVFAGLDSVVEGFINAFKTDLPFALMIAQTYLEIVMLRIGLLFPPLWEFIKTGFENLGEFISSAFFNSFLEGIGKSVEFLRTVPAAIRGILGMDLAGEGILRDISESIKDATTEDFAAIKRKADLSFKEAGSKFSKSFKGTTDDIKEMEEFLADMLDIAKDLGETDPGKSMMSKIAEGIAKIKESMEKDGKDAGSSFATGFREGAKPENLLVFSAAGRRQWEEYTNFLFSLGAEGGVHKGSHKKTKEELFKESVERDKKLLEDAAGGKGKKVTRVMGFEDERPEHTDTRRGSDADLLVSFNSPSDTLEHTDTGRGGDAGSPGEGGPSGVGTSGTGVLGAEGNEEVEIVKKDLETLATAYQNLCKQLEEQSSKTASVIDKLILKPVNLPTEIKFDPINLPTEIKFDDTKSVASPNLGSENSIYKAVDNFNNLITNLGNTISGNTTGSILSAAIPKATEKTIPDTKVETLPTEATNLSSNKSGIVNNFYNNYLARSIEYYKDSIAVSNQILAAINLSSSSGIGQPPTKITDNLIKSITTLAKSTNISIDQIGETVSKVPPKKSVRFPSVDKLYGANPTPFSKLFIPNVKPEGLPHSEEKSPTLELSDIGRGLEVISEDTDSILDQSVTISDKIGSIVELEAGIFDEASAIQVDTAKLPITLDKLLNQIEISDGRFLTLIERLSVIVETNKLSSEFLKSIKESTARKDAKAFGIF